METSPKASNTRLQSSPRAVSHPSPMLMAIPAAILPDTNALLLKCCAHYVCPICRRLLSRLSIITMHTIGYVGVESPVRHAGKSGPLHNCRHTRENGDPGVGAGEDELPIECANNVVQHPEPQV